MPQLCLTFILLCLFGYTVRAQDNRSPDPNNHFIYPSLPGPQSSNDPSVFASNLNFTVGVPIQIPFKWVTNMTDYALVLFQEAPPSVYKTRMLLECGSHGDALYWDGNIGAIDITLSYYAYLGVYNCSNLQMYSTPIFFSHYFNLTAPTVTSSRSSSLSTIASTISPSTSGATSGTSLTTSNTAISTTATSAGSPSASMATPTSQNNSTTTLGAGIGGGIGGAILLVGLGGLLFWWRRRKRRNAFAHRVPTEAQTGYPEDLPKYTVPLKETSELHAQTRPSVRQIHRAELSGANY